ELSTGEPGPVKCRPEAVAGSSEVVPGRAGIEARVDPNEQHAEARFDHVRDRSSGRGAEVVGRRPGHAHETPPWGLAPGAIIPPWSSMAAGSATARRARSAAATAREAWQPSTSEPRS